ncbi:uncharacterized protein LOC136093432 [Hydra vulgaris]|uniref:uncharacterized protein LOC136093432 n=1 Tax=Hydra vulgaris TaxID=6087 RepID=UPI0032E9C4FE
MNTTGALSVEHNRYPTDPGSSMDYQNPGVCESTHFPLKEYWNITTDTRKNTALYLCQEESLVKCCSCNENCFISKTCCIDILWNQINPLPLNEYLEKIVKKSKSIKDSTCEQVIPFSSKYKHTSKKMFMVHSCIEKANVEDKELCINNSNIPLLENIPVFGSDKMLYRNAACARCNSVDYKLVNLTIGCDLPAQVQVKDIFHTNLTYMASSIDLNKRNKVMAKGILNEFDKCIFKIKKNLNNEKYISECGFEEGLFNRKMCHSESPYYDLCNAYSGRFSNYENYDCFRCFGINLNDFNKMNFECLETTEVLQYFSWAVTININDKLEITRGVTVPLDKEFCPKKYYYDWFTGKCETNEKVISTTIASTKSNESHPKHQLTNLTKEELTISLAHFDSCLLSQQPGLFFIINANQVDMFYSEIKTIFQTFITSNLTNKNELILKMSGVLTVDILQSIRSNGLKISRYVSSIIISSVKNQQITSVYGFDVARSYKGNKLCAYSETFEAINVNFTASCNLAGKRISNENMVQWINISSSGIEKKLISYCKSFHLSSGCILQRIKNYTFGHNQTLTFHNNGKDVSLNVNNYVPLKNDIGICIDKVKNNLCKTSFLKVEYFISLIGTSASILCYLSIIIVYMYFQELKTSSSLTSTMLCVNFFFADIVFLIAQVNTIDELCKVISVLLHWFLLVAYHSVLLLAFDIASTFCELKKSFSTRERLLKHFLANYLLPSILVITNISLEKAGVAIGYGKDGVCWINGFYAKLLSYIIPVSIIFVLSFLCLFSTIYKINKSEQRSRKILGEGRKSKNNIARIALKLTIILGVTEFLGLVQIKKHCLKKKSFLIVL